MNPKTRASLLLFAALIACLPLHAQYREFTNKEGVKISAKLIDKNKDTAKIELKDKRVFDVGINTLSDEDQKFISNWWKPEFEIKITEHYNYGELPKGAMIQEKLKGYILNIKQATPKSPQRNPGEISSLRADTFVRFKQELSKIPAVVQKVAERNERDFHLPIIIKIDKLETIHWFVRWEKNADQPTVQLGFTQAPINEQELAELIKFLDFYDVMEEVGKVERIKKSLLK